MTTKIKASVVGYVTAMTAGTVRLSSDIANTPNLGTLRFGNGNSLSLTAGDGNNFQFSGLPLVVGDASEITLDTFGSGSLQVTGGTSISKKLQVSGQTKLANSSDITLGDNTTGALIVVGGSTLRGRIQITDTSEWQSGANNPKGALIVSGAGSFDKDLRAGQEPAGINGTRYIQVNNTCAATGAGGNRVAATVSANAAGGGYAVMQSLGAYSSTDPATTRFAGYSTNGVRILDAVGDAIKFGVQPNAENGNYSVIIKTWSTVATNKDTGGTLQVSGDAAITGDVYCYNAHATTFYGNATSANYADLAEKYLSDANYEPGTVVSFGGDKEITITVAVMDSAVAGVISTNPAYMMNSELQSGLYVALTGRVPCKVIGPVKKGDLMVGSGIHGVATAWTNVNDTLTPGSVIGKALENYNDSVNVGVIEVVVGRV